MTKNKQNYTKIIYNILEKHFREEWEKSHEDLWTDPKTYEIDDDEYEKQISQRKLESLDYCSERDILQYIYNELKENKDFLDELTVVDGKGGEQDEKVGMIEFLNQFGIKFIDNNFIDKVSYQFKEIQKIDNSKYYYLEDFFTDFISLKRDLICNKVINFNNKQKEIK